MLAQQMKTTAIRKLLAGTPFRWTEVSEFVAESAAEDGCVNDEMRATASQIVEHLGTTLSTELSFQKQENETRFQKNKSNSSVSLWTTPTRTQLLSKEFDFTEVSVNDVVDDDYAKALSVRMSD